MNRIMKWGLRAGLGIVGAAVLAAGGVFAGSEIMRAQKWDKRDDQITVSRDPAAVARGARLAKIYGCHDCHGADFTGRRFHDDALVTITGPNLTLAAAHQTDADLARAIRAGVAADGRGLWIMPSDAFSTLTDQETADLIAYLRGFPAKGQTVADPVKVSFVARVGVVLGKFKSAPSLIEAGLPQALDAGPEHAEGRALSRPCMECHGLDLAGLNGALITPDLTRTAAYSPAEFTRLMRTGVAAGERQVGLMSATSRARFDTLTDPEIEALYGYLKARAEQTP